MPNRSTTDQSPASQVKAELFRVLGHPARVRILELLAEGERTVGDLQAALGLDSSGTSQHLGALRRRDLVEPRRHGTNVYYRIKDPQTTELLESARKIISASIQDSQTLLEQLADPGTPDRP
jgi:DNA-binding transcriptional ArsR family regulator